MYLLWILIVFLAIRLLFGWIMPLVLPFFLKRLMNRNGQDFGAFKERVPYQQPEPQNINKSKPASSKEDEYVDFEEVK